MPKQTYKKDVQPVYKIPKNDFIRRYYKVEKMSTCEISEMLKASDIKITPRSISRWVNECHRTRKPKSRFLNAIKRSRMDYSKRDPSFYKNRKINYAARKERHGF